MLALEVLVMEVMKDYVAHLDNKKRITLRGAVSNFKRGDVSPAIDLSDF